MTAAQQKFIDTIAPLAVADWKEHRVLPSLTLAQAVIESAFGTSELAVQANNLFGIKGGDLRWSGAVYEKVTKEFVDGKYVDKKLPFRKYFSWAESVRDHGEFLQAARYALVLGETNYKTACEAIKAAGYATSPTYVSTLVNAIEKYGLHKYDKESEVKKMSNSSLVSYTKISPNSNNPRNAAIKKITPHHMAGNQSLASFGNLVAQPSRQMSSNYAIDSNGNIGLYCEEKNRSWCSSSPANDHQAITIEVANDGGAPDWHVSDKALAALINLCVDICQRNGIPALNFTGNANGNLTQHNYFTATACPGSYLKSKFPYIAEQVNKRLSASGGSQDTSGGTDANCDVLYRVQVGAFSKKENATATLNKMKAKKFDAFITEVGGLYKVQAGAYKSKANAEAQAAKIRAAGFEAIITTNGASTATAPTGGSFKAYVLQVTGTYLNIREAPTTDSKILGTVKKGEAYTIVEEATGTGASKWGRLKSGAGWIALDYTKKLKEV